MNLSEFKSYTAKQNSIFSCVVPRRNVDNPENQASDVNKPAFNLSHTQNMRSINMSSVIMSKVLCNSSLNTILSIPCIDKQMRR